MQAQPHIKHKNEIKNISAVPKTWRTVTLGHVSEHNLFMFCSSGKTGQYSRRVRVRVPAGAILVFFFPSRTYAKCSYSLSLSIYILENRSIEAIK